jgi:autotransporter-associated beta strand protein
MPAFARESRLHRPTLWNRLEAVGRRVAVACLAAMLLVATPGAEAQIVVGGTGSDTTDSTNYSGAQSLTKVGTNTVTLTGTSTYSGGTIINAGALAITAGGNIGTGSMTLAGGTLSYGGAAATFTRQIAIPSDSGIAVTSGSTLTWQGNINGDGRLTLTGPGTLLLNGGYDNTVNGILVQSGTLRAAHAENYFLLGYQRGTGGGIDSSLLDIGPAGTVLVEASNNFPGGVVQYPNTTYANTPVQIAGGAMTFAEPGSGSQANTIGKFTFVNGGTLTIGNLNRVDLNSLGGIVSTGTGAATITGTGNINIVKRASGDAPTIDVAASAPLTVGAPITSVATGFATGNLPITKVGSGTMSLTKSLGSAGGITINEGVLRFAGDATVDYLVGGTPVTVNGGTLDYGGFQEGSGSVTLVSGLITNGTAFGASYSLQSGTVNASMIGGNATKTTAGTVVLTQSNSYGSTTISSGTLRVGAGGAAGTLGAGSVTNNATLVFDRSGVLDQSAAISGTGTVILQGPGSVDLRNTLGATGGVTVQAGTLRFAGSAAVDYIAAGTPVTVDGGTMDYGGYSESTGASLTLRSGVITNGTATVTQFAVESGTMSIGLSGTGGITKTTAGTAVLSGSSAATGPVAVSAGVLAVTGVNRLPTSGTVTIDPGATLRVSGAQTLALLQGTGEVNIASGSLTTGVQAQTFAGTITGPGSLVKTGAALTTLSGSNSYSGGTTINGGSLFAPANNALGTGVVTLSGGTLQLGPSVAVSNDLVLDGAAATTAINGALNVDYLVVGGGGGGAGRDAGGGGGGGGVLAGNIGVGAAATTVTVGSGGAGGVNSQSGARGGSSLFGSLESIGGGGGGYWDGSPTTGGSGGGGSGYAPTSGAAGVAGQGFGGGNGAGGTISGVGGGGGGAAAVGGFGTTNTAGNGGSGLATTIRGGSETFSGGGGGAAHRGFTAATSGTGGAGGGGNAAASEATTPAAGVANSGGGGGASRSADSARYTGGDGGSGIVVIRYLGAPVATGGTIVSGTGSASGYTIHQFTTTGASTFSLNNPISTTLSGNLSGTGGFTYSTYGTLTLTGTNTYSGGTIIASGTVQVGDGGTSGSLGSGPVSNNNGVLIFNRSNALTYGGEITGTAGGSVVKRGTGTLTLTGTSVYGGPMTVEAGNLRINGGLAPSQTSVLAGATLSGIGLINGTVTIAGTHAPGNSPGTQAFTDNLIYLGGSALAWELAGNTAATSDRGTLYDGVNCTGGNLTFSGSTAVGLSFNGAGSTVNWSDPFWNTSRSGTNGWLVYDMLTGIATGGTTTGASFLAISGTSWLDSNGTELLATRPYASFSIEQVGQDVYLTFSAVPEPASVAFITIGGLAVGAVALRRSRSRSRRSLRGTSVGWSRLALMVAVAAIPSSTWAAETIYVSLNNDTVVTYDVTGTNGVTIAATKATFASTNLSDPQGLVLDSQGNLWAANYRSDTISKFNSSGVFQSSITGNLASPYGLVRDESGTLSCASTFGVGSSVSKYDASGTYTGAITANLNGPVGLARDSAGRLYAVNADSDNVTVYDAAGTYQRTITGSLSFPTGIAISPANTMYVASGNAIRVFDAAGTLQSSITSNLSGPQGLGLDSVGNLYAANFFSNSISKYDPSGAFVTSWSVGTARPAFVAFQPAAVPEPGSVGLAACGLATAGFGLWRRRRKAGRRGSV